MTVGVIRADFSGHVTRKSDVMVLLGELCDYIDEEGTWTREIVC
jgi:hypothetical protein